MSIHVFRRVIWATYFLVQMLFVCVSGNLDKSNADVLAGEPSDKNGKELISNPSVEETKNGMPAGYIWNGQAMKVEAKAKVETVNDAHSGKNAICVTRLNDAGEYVVYPSFEKITASNSPHYYVASVWLKSKAEGPLAAQLQYSNARWTKGYTQVLTVYSDWKQYYLLIRTEPGDDIAYLRVKMCQGLIGDQLFMDDFSMREVSAATFEEFQKVNQQAARIEWAKQPVSPKSQAGINLLSNSSFEHGLEHWGLSITMSSRSNEDRIQGDRNERKHGLSSLRFNSAPRWYDNGSRLQSPPIAVKKGQTYTLSAYLKCNKPGITGQLEIRHSSSKAAAANEPIQLSQEWTRHSMSFKVGECPYGTAIACVQVVDSWLSKKDFDGLLIWVDAIQLEEGGLSDYAPAPKVEVSGSTVAKRGLFVEGDPITLSTRMTVPDALAVDSNSRWELEYSLANAYGKVVETKLFPVIPGNQKTIEHTYTWDTRLLGSYCAKMTLKTGTVVLAQAINPFAVLPKLPEAIRQKNAFFGVNTSSSRSFYEIARLMGVGSIRFHDDYYFRWNMLKQDRSDPYWYEPDKEAVIRNMKDSGMRLLGNFELSTSWASTAPDTVKGWERIKYPPNLDDWRVFVRDQTLHFKGLIDIWEVWNEPYLPDWWRGTASQYVAMMEAASQEVKKVDETIPIVGICGQPHFGGWNAECVGLGAMKSMNVFSYHDYVSGMAGGVNEWLSSIKTLHESLAKTRQGVPVWNTECGIGEGLDSWYGPFYGDQKNMPHYGTALMVQSYVVSLAGGVDRLYWYILGEDRGPANVGRLPMLEYNGKPKSAIPAYATCVKHLSGKKLVKDISDRNRCCFVFTGDGESVAVLWRRTKDTKKMTVELPSSKVRGFDCMGNGLSSDQETTLLEVDMFPIYIQGTGTVNDLERVMAFGLDAR